ncbi:MAG: hypothetical protein ABJA78_01545 [Ferruginibacter sp.]
MLHRLSGLFVWLCLFFLSNCYYTSRKQSITKHTGNEMEIKGYKLTYSCSPSIATIAAFNDFTRSDTLTAEIYFYQNWILYKAGHQVLKHNSQDKPWHMELDHFVLLRAKGSSSGLYYALKNDNPVQKINVDSFLKREWYAQINIDAIFPESIHTLTFSDSGTKSKGYQERYQLLGRGADSDKKGNGLFVYSADIKNPAFHLSPVTDSLKKVTMVFAHTETEARTFPGYTFKMPRIEQSWGLEEINSVDSNTVSYFKEAEKTGGIR